MVVNQPLRSNGDDPHLGSGGQPPTFEKIHPLHHLSSHLPIFAPKAVYRIIPAPSQVNAATVTTEPRPRVYTQSEINQMTAGTAHPYILRTLIK
jgi:hypothetical protein